MRLINETRLANTRTEKIVGAVTKTFGRVFSMEKVSSEDKFGEEKRESSVFTGGLNLDDIEGSLHPTIDETEEQQKKNTKRPNFVFRAAHGIGHIASDGIKLAHDGVVGVTKEVSNN